MRRRLIARYDCIHPGHHLCFVGESRKHVPLTGTDIDAWVDAWVRGLQHLLTQSQCFQFLCHASLLYPPQSIIPPSDISDTASTRSNSSHVSGRSKSSVEYNRPIRLKLNPSLVDVRSIYERCLIKSSSDLSSEFSGSGVGSTLGRLTWRLGKIMIKPVVSFQIIRSLRETRKLIRLLGTMDVGDRSFYFKTNAGKIHRLSADLLELYK